MQSYFVALKTRVTLPPVVIAAVVNQLHDDPDLRALLHDADGWSPTSDPHVPVPSSPQSENISALLDELAAHPAAIVRAATAASSHLSRAAWLTLVEDAHPKVVLEALTGRYRHEVTAAMALAAYSRFPQLVHELKHFWRHPFHQSRSHCTDLEALADFYTQQSDPHLLAEIASDEDMPLSLLQRLATNSDLHVRHVARQTLAQLVAA